MKGFLMTLCGLAALLCLFFLFHEHKRKGAQTLIDQAFQYYKKGEVSETLTQRKDNFNSALEIYVRLEKEYPAEAGTGKLYYNIGNTYFQLGEYPLAILYYYKALTLMPRSHEVKQNLAIAQEKLHLSTTEVNPSFLAFFFFYYNLSLPEIFQIFLFIGLTLVFLLFAYIWHPKRWIAKTAIILIFFNVIVLSSLIYKQYFEPMEGVLVRGTSLYRDAGKQYAKASNQPLTSGLKVQVLDTREEGQWLKIITPDGTLGFVPIESIRVL